MSNNSISMMSLRSDRITSHKLFPNEAGQKLLKYIKFGRNNIGESSLETPVKNNLENS